MNTLDITLDQLTTLERLAQIIAKSGMGGFKNPEQATVGLLLALGEGIPLGRMIHEYHVINGRLSLRSECMLARFQRSGGRIEYLTYTPEEVKVTASHPAGGSLTVSWTIDRARRSGVARGDIWDKHPAAMLKARAVAEAVRAVYPACLSGLMAEEEAQEIGAERLPLPNGSNGSTHNAATPPARECLASVVPAPAPVPNTTPTDVATPPARHSLASEPSAPAPSPEPREYNIDRVNEPATRGTPRPSRRRAAPISEAEIEIKAERQSLAEEITQRMTELKVPEPVIPAHVAKQPQTKDEDHDYADAPDPRPYTPRYPGAKSPISEGPLSELIAPYNEHDVNEFMIARGLLHKGQTHRDAQPYVVDRVRNQWASFLAKGNFRPSATSPAIA